MIDAVSDSAVMNDIREATVPLPVAKASAVYDDSQRAGRLEAGAVPRGLPAVVFTLGVLFLIFAYTAVRDLFQAQTFLPLSVSLSGLGITYALLLIEYQWSVRQGHVTASRLAGLWPPVRLTARDGLTGTRMWVPGLGWAEADRTLTERIETFTTLFLLASALLLGVIAGTAHLRGYRGGEILELTVFQVVVLAVWLVIVLEFILLWSLSRRQLEFFRRHRLHVVIALTPMLVFLRFALLVRIIRGVIQFETVQCFLHRGAHRRLKALEQELSAREEDVAHLRTRIEAERLRLAELEQNAGA